MSDRGSNALSRVPFYCVAGACVLYGCPTSNCCPCGLSICGSQSCVDLKADDLNCGACGVACGGAHCSAGSCACPEAWRTSMALASTSRRASQIAGVAEQHVRLAPPASEGPAFLTVLPAKCATNCVDLSSTKGPLRLLRSSLRRHAHLRAGAVRLPAQAERLRRLLRGPDVKPGQLRQLWNGMFRGRRLQRRCLPISVLGRRDTRARALRKVVDEATTSRRAVVEKKSLPAVLATNREKGPAARIADPPTRFAGEGDAKQSEVGGVVTLLEAIIGALFAALRPRASLVIENLALRQQLSILRRSRPRPGLRPLDRAHGEPDLEPPPSRE